MNSIDGARPYVSAFAPFRLTLARHYRGMRKVDLARHLNVTPSAVTQLESGASRPKASTLAQISLSLGFPPAFFAADGRRRRLDDHGRAFFRSLRSTRQLDRDQAEAQAFFASEILDTIERHVRLPASDLPTTLYAPEEATLQDIEQRAIRLRDLWSVPAGPTASMVRLLEAHGVVVTRCVIEADEVHAFSRWFAHRPLVVLSADRNDLPRLRFDAAHELGHLVLHAEVEPGNRILEQQAHRFAAAFLMPKDEIAGQLPPTFRLDEYGHLKEVWGVSMQALLYRARDLRRMTDATFRRAMIRLSALGRRKNEPYPLYGHEPSALWPRAKEILATRGVGVDAVAHDARLPLDFVSRVFEDDYDERPALFG